MKNLIKFLSIVFVLFITMPAHAAKSVKVSALSEFSSLNPPKTMKVMVLEKSEFKNGLVFEDGTVLNGMIFDVKQPKRGKRNATFKFQPTTYTYNGKTTTIEDEEFIAKYKEYKELDKKALATTAATSAGGMLLHVPMFSEAVSLIKGMVKNEKDNRLKSGVVQVYKDSPLSYVEEGKDIEIKKDTMFILKFKSSDAEDLDDDDTELKDNEKSAAQYEMEEELSQTGETLQDVKPVSHTQSTTNVQLKSSPTPIKEDVPVIQNSHKSIQVIHPDDVLQEVELKLGY